MKSEKSPDKDTKRKHQSPLDRTGFAFLALILTASIVSALWWKVPQWAGQGLTTSSERGTLGDSFGSVNALFTGLAFAGVVFSILLQQRQIRLQREDFLSQLEEMEGSRETLETQNKLLAAQNDLMRGQNDVALSQLKETMESRVTADAQNKLLAMQNQLLRGQTEVAMLELEAQAMQLDSQVDELEISRMGATAVEQPKAKLAAMRSRGDHLRMKLAELEKHIIHADRAAG